MDAVGEDGVGAGAEGERDGEEGDERGVRVENLVKEFLSAQTLSVLEENGLGEAIESFVDKDDKRALQDFVEDTLKEHVDVFPPPHTSFQR
jgi:hypothetical protein